MKIELLEQLVNEITNTTDKLKLLCVKNNISIPVLKEDFIGNSEYDLLVPLRRNNEMLNLLTA